MPAPHVPHMVGQRAKGRPHLLVNYRVSPAGLPKGSPLSLHTAAITWALAVPHFFKRHSLTLCIF